VGGTGSIAVSQVGVIFLCVFGVMFYGCCLSLGGVSSAGGSASPVNSQRAPPSKSRVNTVYLSFISPFFLFFYFLFFLFLFFLFLFFFL
jgi:hypothetical protein